MAESNENTGNENESTETEAASEIGLIKAHILKSIREFQYWKWARRVGGIVTFAAVVIIAIVLALGFFNEEVNPSAAGSSAGSTVPGVTLSTEEYEALVQKRVDAEVDSSLLRGRFNARVDKRVDQLVEAEVAKAIAELPRTVDMGSGEVGMLIGEAVDERVKNALTSLVETFAEREEEHRQTADGINESIRQLVDATETRTLLDLRQEFLMNTSQYTGLPVRVMPSSDTR